MEINSEPENTLLERKLNEAAGILLSSQYAVALVGAGLSVESGIPTYRGPGGLWSKGGEPAMLSYKEFVRDPKLWWEMRLAGELEPRLSPQAPPDRRSGRSELSPYAHLPDPSTRNGS